MNLKKNDTVIVISGKEKGKKGKIIRVLPDKGLVVVEKINVAKRHQKPTRDFQGGIIEKPMPLDRSKVVLVCPRCGKPSRVAMIVMENKKRARSCKKCKEMIDKE